MKKYLLPENGQFYKANLHCHSTVSDGHLTPEEMLGHAESSNTTALITATVIAQAFAIPGVIILLKAFKGGQSAAKCKKRA